MTAKPAAVTATLVSAEPEPAYRRILLKLSGEALMGDDSYGINREVIDRIVAEIGEVVRLGVEIAVSRPAPQAWTARPPTTWACSRR